MAVLAPAESRSITDCFKSSRTSVISVRKYARSSRLIALSDASSLCASRYTSIESFSQFSSFGPITRGDYTKLIVALPMSNEKRRGLCRLYFRVYFRHFHRGRVRGADAVDAVQGGDFVALSQRRIVENTFDEVVDAHAAGHDGLANVDQFGGAGADGVDTQ